MHWVRALGKQIKETPNDTRKKNQINQNDEKLADTHKMKNSKSVTRHLHGLCNINICICRRTLGENAIVPLLNIDFGPRTTTEFYTLRELWANFQNDSNMWYRSHFSSIELEISHWIEIIFLIVLRSAKCVWVFFFFVRKEKERKKKKTLCCVKTRPLHRVKWFIQPDKLLEIINGDMKLAHMAHQRTKKWNFNSPKCPFYLP